MFYIVTTDEGTRVTQKAPCPMEAVQFLAMVRGHAELYWMVYAGEPVDDDFIVPKLISPMRKRGKAHD
jgi:hypothetical protein